ncbi:MAG: DUF86 domain-containing protein [Spirochaetes bacterium]|nr:DUF86 domain-containing protein [Spirochaetota bacterium]
MTKAKIRESVISERVSWIREMLTGIEKLPLADMRSFAEDPRNTAAAESYLRRALEALMDLGRHILAKGFAVDVADYKGIPAKLGELGIITPDTAATMKKLAGYRNRMVHFYNEISETELYEICRDELKDVNSVLNGILSWINSHPEMIDTTL